MNPRHLIKDNDEATLRALSNINASQEGMKLKEWLAGLIHQADVNNRTFSGDALMRSQGSVQMLQAIYDSLETARDRLKT